MTNTPNSSVGAGSGANPEPPDTENDPDVYGVPQGTQHQGRGGQTTQPVEDDGAQDPDPDAQGGSVGADDEGPAEGADPDAQGGRRSSSQQDG